MLKLPTSSVSENGLRRHLLPKILTELEPEMLSGEAVTAVTSNPNLLNTLLAVAINKKHELLQICMAQAMKERDCYSEGRIMTHCIPTLLMHLWMYEKEMFKVVSNRTTFVDQSIGQIVGQFGIGSVEGNYTGHCVFTALLETQAGSHYTPTKKAGIMNTVGMYTLERLNHLLDQGIKLPVRYDTGINTRFIAFADVVTTLYEDTDPACRLVPCLDCTKKKDRIRWLSLSKPLRLEDRVLFWPHI